MKLGTKWQETLKDVDILDKQIDFGIETRWQEGSQGGEEKKKIVIKIILQWMLAMFLPCAIFSQVNRVEQLSKVGKEWDESVYS